MGGRGPPETTTIPEEGPWRGPKKTRNFGPLRQTGPPKRPNTHTRTRTRTSTRTRTHHTTPNHPAGTCGRTSWAQKFVFGVWCTEGLFSSGLFFLGGGGCGGVSSGASEGSSEFQQLRQECDDLNVHSRNLETETLACQSARSIEQQVAQIPHLRDMFEVQKKPTTVQAEVLRLRAENLSLSQNLDRSKEEVAKMQARCNEFWHHSDTACAR